MADYFEKLFCTMHCQPLLLHWIIKHGRRVSYIIYCAVFMNKQMIHKHEILHWFFNLIANYTHICNYHSKILNWIWQLNLMHLLTFQLTQRRDQQKPFMFSCVSHYISMYSLFNVIKPMKKWVCYVFMFVINSKIGVSYWKVQNFKFHKGNSFIVVYNDSHLT